MATTRLADVYVPSVGNPLIFREALARQKVLSSGAVQLNATMSAQMTGNGIVFPAPYNPHLADSDVAALIPSDDPDEIGVPEKLSTGIANYHRLARNNGWASMDVVTDITGRDPMAQVAAQYGGKLAKNREVALMSQLAGVMNATVAGTTLYRMIGQESTGGSASTRFNPDAIIDAAYAVYGDNMDASGLTMLTHPEVLARLVKDDLIEYVKPSEQDIAMPTYMGIRVVTSRVAPKRAGTTSGSVYTTYVFRNGTIQMGVGSADTPTEIERKPSIGNSGGGDIFWARDVFGYHIDGFSFTGSANYRLSNANLATASNWTRVLAPEQIGIFAIASNIA